MQSPEMKVPKSTSAIKSKEKNNHADLSLLFRVLDLFCGAGGLALGFSMAGFSVTGVDISMEALSTFSFNRTGRPVKADLLTEYIDGRYEIVVGGPPCKPWSCLNLRKRGEKHKDYILLDRFFEHVLELKPYVFVFENVPLIRDDRKLNHYISLLKKKGYDQVSRIIKYSDWGAASSRRRFFLIGVLKKLGSAGEIWMRVEEKKCAGKTVREAIEWLCKIPHGAYPDHEWPQFRTIRKYLEKYRTGKYGWYILPWDSPAPSFGNIMKTYILHPASLNGGPVRVISVREALCIMGFPEEFRFPPGTGISTRYQMIADTVSPMFSRAVAEAIKSFLEEK